MLYPVVLRIAHPVRGGLRSQTIDVTTKDESDNQDRKDQGDKDEEEDPQALWFGGSGGFVSVVCCKASRKLNMT